jgi:hypothetical protein
MRPSARTGHLARIGLAISAAVGALGAAYFGPVHAVMELGGIFAFAVLGALVGVRRGHNLANGVVLAEVTALGGGLVRDLSTGATPVAFTNLSYFLTPVAAALVVYALRSTMERAVTSVLVLDAIWGEPLLRERHDEGLRVRPGPPPRRCARGCHRDRWRYVA